MSAEPSPPSRENPEGGYQGEHGGRQSDDDELTDRTERLGREIAAHLERLRKR